MRWTCIVRSPDILLKQINAVQGFSVVFVKQAPRDLAMKIDIVLQLEAALLREARSLAAEKGTSVSALLTAC